MADTYILNFTDNDNTKKFSISPYTTNGTTSPTSNVLSAKSVSANTSLLFFGKGMDDYGERTAENFLHLLENFSGKVEPINPIQGQIWFDTNDNVLKVFSISNLEIFYKDTNNKIRIRIPGTAGKTYQSIFKDSIISRFTPGFKFNVYGLDAVTNPNNIKNLIGEYVVNSQPISINDTEIEVELVNNNNIKISPTEVSVNYNIGMWMPISKINSNVANDILTDPLKNFKTLSVPTEDLDLGGYSLLNLGPATNSGDAISLGFADNRYVNKASDVMDNGSLLKAFHFTVQGNTILADSTIGGTLTTNGNATFSQNVAITGALTTTADSTFSNKLDVNGILNVGSNLIVAGSMTGDSLTITYNITASGDISNNGTLTTNGNVAFNSDLTVSNLTTLNGQTTFGSIIDANNNIIINHPQPVNNSDVANKEYVDLAVAAGGGGSGTGDEVLKSSGLLQQITSGALQLDDQPEQPGQVVPTVGILPNHAATVAYVDKEIDDETIRYNGNPPAKYVINGSTNGNVIYKATVNGIPGTSYTIQHAQSGTNTPLSIVVTGNDVVVNLATDGSGAITSTANDIVTAVNNDTNASLLMVASSNPGTGIAGAGGPFNLSLSNLIDIHLTSANYNTTSDQLELLLSDGDGITPDIIVSNLGANILSTTSTASFDHTITPITDNDGDALTSTFINSSNYPTVKNNILLTEVSKIIKNISSKVEQSAEVLAASQSIFTVPNFTPGLNGLDVYVNGLKKIVNRRAYIKYHVPTITTTNPFKGIYLSAPTGLSNDATVYQFTITVDGGTAQTVSLVGSENQYIYQVIKNIMGGNLYNTVTSSYDLKVSQAVGCTVVIEGDGKLVFYSDNNTTISDIQITDIDFFSSILINNIDAIAIESTISSQIFDYAENGTYGIYESGTQIEFNTPLNTGDVVEFKSTSTGEVFDIDKLVL